MMQVLQSIKTHLISLLCGVAAIAAICVGALGMSSDGVVEKMKKEISDIGASSVASLRSKAQNEDTIDKKKRQGELFEREYLETVEETKRINRRDVLKEGVFPEAETTAMDFEFKEIYRRTAERLWTGLDAGTLPVAAEIQEEAENVEDLLALEAEQKAEEEEGEAGRSPRVTRAPSGRTPFGRAAPGFEPPAYAMGRGGGRMAGEGVGRYGGPVMPTGGRSTPLSVANTGEPKYNAVYRARVSKAKNILCYYDEATFHVSPLAYDEGRPTPEGMWFAQVGLWIQQDVVKAIAELNGEVANTVEGDACVEHVPVKRLVLLRVRGYESTGEQGPIFFAAAGGAAIPPKPASLTGRKCNEQYDVVRFVVTVVVDQRDVLQLIDHISRVNFYQCLGASYEAVDSKAELNEGYFYGTDPVVRLTLEFEGYMAREIYKEIMPSKVREMLGIDTKDSDD